MILLTEMAVIDLQLSWWNRLLTIFFIKYITFTHTDTYFHLNNSGCWSRRWCYWKLLEVELEVQGGRNFEMLVDLVGMVFLWQFWNNSCHRVFTKLIIEIPCLVLKFLPGSLLVLVCSLLVFKYWSKHCWNIFFCIPLINYFNLFYVAVNVGEDCPVFDGLYEFCQLSAGGSVAAAVKLNKQASEICINWGGG